ncbi:hypothetical protein EJ110_NYTH38481 [Nymphaea thermarum]|nr:hypothetical protein EJ110_NYTH38481 [Nymphaea thermarum]
MHNASGWNSTHSKVRGPTSDFSSGWNSTRSMPPPPALDISPALTLPRSTLFPVISSLRPQLLLTVAPEAAPTIATPPLPCPNHRRSHQRLLKKEDYVYSTYRDAFFSAVEEVQESADSMESAYRIWERERKDGFAMDDSDELRKELHTALGTTKWQLSLFIQEFELINQASTS